MSASKSAYTVQAARDAEANIGKTKFWTRRYADYLESTTLEMAAKRPDLADYLMNRSLGEALRGNEGD